MATMTTLVPIQEMTPGQVGKIRNDVINFVVALAARELKKDNNDLVVRDVRPFRDLDMYAAATTALTVDRWSYSPTTITADAYTTVTGTQTMDDNKFVALFGVRDLRRGIGTHTTAMAIDFESTDADAVAMLGPIPAPGATVSLIKLNVGGADKVIWDLTGIEAYLDANVGFTSAPVVIPQNTSYNIGYYFPTNLSDLKCWLQLIGVVVEPRGLTISP